MSVTDHVGNELALRYGARAVPTFVLLDGAGEVMLKQTGMPDRDEIKTAVAALSQ